MQLGWLDALIFVGYFVGVVIFGVSVAAFSKEKTSQSYFLASKRLPWYAVGASFVTSNISTEHFIGMIGWAYLYGISISHWCWANVATFSMLIWVFCPSTCAAMWRPCPSFWNDVSTRPAVISTPS